MRKGCRGKGLRRDRYDSRHTTRAIGEPLSGGPQTLCYGGTGAPVPASGELLSKPWRELQVARLSRQICRVARFWRHKSQVISTKQLNDQGFAPANMASRQRRGLAPHSLLDAFGCRGLQPPNRGGHSKQTTGNSRSPTFPLRLPLCKGRRGFPHLVGPSLFWGIEGFTTTAQRTRRNASGSCLWLWRSWVYGELQTGHPEQSEGSSISN